MILFYSDVHLGQRTYGTQHQSGYYTSELDTINALEYLYEYSQSSEIDTIICGGDYFHSNRPSSSNIKYAIEWFTKMDALNKPHYIIPGNHDASLYDHALSFLAPLNLHNTHLIDSYTPYKIKWNNWQIVFVPYQASLASSKYKEQIFYSNISDALSSAEDNTIIVTHIQEKSALVGSEAVLISKGVDLVDVEEFDHNKKILVLTGHVHRPQIYDKSTLTIAYPGSINYINKTDLGTSKGFYTIDTIGNIQFIESKNIRKFIKYTIPKETDIEDYFKNIRMSPNQVIFLEIHSDHIFDENNIRLLFNKYNSIIGNISLKSNSSSELQDLIIETNVIDPHNMFLNYVVNNYSDYDSTFKDDLQNMGLSYLDNYMGIIEEA